MSTNEGTQEPVSTEEQSEEVDDKGVAWKNRAKEYERKYEKLQKELKSGQQSLVKQEAEIAHMRELLTQIQAQQTSPQAAAKDTDTDLDELFYTNPTKALKKVLESSVLPELSKQVDSKIGSLENKITQSNQQAQYNAQAVSRYPQLNDPDSEFFQKVVDVADELSARNPIYKDAPDLSIVAADIAAARYPELLRGEDSGDAVAPARTNPFSSGGSKQMRRAKKKSSAISEEEKAIHEKYKEMAKGLGVELTEAGYLKQREDMKRKGKTYGIPFREVDADE